MSVLSLPRIHLSGDAIWNPATPNNSPGVYNENTLQQVNPPAPADFVTWLKTYTTNPPLGQSGLNGSWNVYGDGGCWYRNARVTTVQREYGKSTTDDPLCTDAGAELKIIGQSFSDAGGAPARMVDVAPYQSSTTQIFYKFMQLGTKDLGFRATGAWRMFTRWPWYSRNLVKLPIAGRMGVVFQTAAHAADVEWYGLEKSPVLKALHDAATSAPNQGIVFQFAAYRTLYYQNATWKGKRIETAEDLATAYAEGFAGPNPAECLLIGTIGVWGPDELASAPTQILLNPQDAITPPAVPLSPLRAVQEGMIAAPPEAAPQPVTLGPAMVWLDEGAKNLALNFVSTIPESGAKVPKADLGALAVRAGGADVVTIPYSSPDFKCYDQTGYQRTAGILDFALTPAQVTAVKNAIAAGTLQIVQKSSGKVPLQQTLWVAETDQRGEYLDQDQQKSIAVHVYRNGLPASGIKLHVTQYVENMSDLNYDIVSPAGQSPAPIVDLGNGQFQLDVDVINGVATIPIKYVNPGTAMLGFYPPGSEVVTDGFPSPTTAFYAVIRLLGADNALMKLPDDQINWPKTYAEVLEVYNLVYPEMSRIRNLADANVVKGMAEQILALTKYPENFFNTLFMPVSREMSAGKRNLLQRFCVKVINNEI